MRVLKEKTEPPMVKNIPCSLMVFGDIHLEDVREYREGNLAKADFQGHWPVWGQDAASLTQGFLDAGFKAKTVAVDGEKLGRAFVGRDVNNEFLNELPDDVDTEGERGEYHTFVWDGPTFERPISLNVRETVVREVGDTEMCYCELQFEEPR